MSIVILYLEMIGVVKHTLILFLAKLIQWSLN